MLQHYLDRSEHFLKIYRLHNGLTLVGKPWEIREKLKEYGKRFETVQQWIEESEKTPNKPRHQRTQTEKVIWVDFKSK